MAKFQKGQSGNPGGRRPMPADVREALEAVSVEAVEKLVIWMRSDHATASPAAANSILDRLYGRPAQAVKVSGDDSGDPIRVETSMSEVARRIAFLLASGSKP